MTCADHSAMIFVGAATEVETLKKALGEAKKNAAKEQAACEKLFDPLFGSSFRTPDRVSGATVHTMTFLLHNCIAYLKAC